MARKGEFYNIEDVEFKNERQKQVAILIMEILKASGLSQSEFAKKMQVSLATFTNPLRPYFGKVPAKSYIRKISDQTDNPEETYNMLMDAAGYSIEDFPYKYGTITEKPVRVPEVILRDRIVSEISKLPIKGSHEYEVRLKGRIIHDVVFNYADTIAPIDMWVVDTCSDTRLPESIAKDYLYSFFKEGTTDKTAKYSLVTSSIGVFNELTSLDLTSINLLMSVILFQNDEFKEAYLNTAVNYDKLNEAGLSL